jgi:hypothetical protein
MLYTVTQARLRRQLKTLPMSKYRNAAGISESVKPAKTQPCGSLTSLKNLSEPLPALLNLGWVPYHIGVKQGFNRDHLVDMRFDMTNSSTTGYGFPDPDHVGCWRCV